MKVKSFFVSIQQCNLKWFDILANKYYMYVAPDILFICISKLCTKLKCRGCEWSFKTHGSHKMFVKFHTSQNLIFYQLTVHPVHLTVFLTVLIFCKVKKVSKSQFIFFLSEPECLKLAFKTFEVSISQLKKWKCLRLSTKMLISVAFLQRVAFAISSHFTM